MKSVTERMHGKATIGLSIVLVLLLCSTAISSVAAQTLPSSNTTAGAKYPPYPVNLYEFYRSDCPHCRALMPTVDALSYQYPTLRVYKIEIQNGANYTLFTDKFMPAYGVKIDSVPTIFIGAKVFQGGEEMAPRIQAEVARAVQNGATGQGDLIMGRVVPTPTPIPQTRTSNVSANATTQDSGTAGASQESFPLALFISTGLISGMNPVCFPFSSF